MKRLIIAALAIVAMVGCTKDKEPSVKSQDLTAVEFSDAQISTRTVENEWEDGDLIGIYMYPTGKTTAATGDCSRENVKYETDEYGYFSVVESADLIYYPADKATEETTKVDFYAYYPYMTENTIDITKQNPNADGTAFDQGAVDYMVGYETVSDTEAGITSKDRNLSFVDFTFKHALSKVTISVTISGTPLSAHEFSSMKVSLGTINTTATISNKMAGGITPNDGTGTIYLQPTTDDTGDVSTFTATAILIPGTIANGAKLLFDIFDMDCDVEFPNDDLLAGKNYTYNLTISNNNVLFEECTVTDWNNSSTDIFIDKDDSN